MSHRTLALLCVALGVPLAGLGFYVVGKLDDSDSAPFRGVFPNGRGAGIFLGWTMIALGLVLAVLFGGMFGFS